METKICTKCKLNPAHRKGICVSCNKIANKISNQRRIKPDIKKSIVIEGEVWKPIKEYFGEYEVSNFGRVKSVERICYYNNGEPFLLRERVRELADAGNGYFKIMLYRLGKGRPFWVHRLVADAFIENPLGKPFVNHKNGNGKDNKVENLEWCTAKENTAHAIRELGFRPDSGKIYRGAEHIQSIPIKQIDLKSGKIIKTWECIAAVKKSKTASNPSLAAKGILKTSGGFGWSF